MGDEYDNPNKTPPKPLKLGFNCLSATSVIQSTSSCGWSSKGLRAVLVITGQHFPLLLMMAQ